MPLTTFTLASENSGRLRRMIAGTVLVSLAITFILAIATPNLLRSRTATPPPSRYMTLAEPGAAAQSSPVAAAKLASDSAPAAPDVDTRKIVRNGSMALIVRDVLRTVTDIEKAARAAGGYVQSSSVARTDADVRQASLRLSIPAEHLDEVRARLRELAVKIDAEQVQSQEVTAEYTDLQSSLRNFRAEEQQYLAIMQRAGTIRDTLEVARSLADVRGRIEHTQGRLNLLDHQVAMATLEVSVRTDALPVAAIPRWQPVARVRQAFWNAADNLADFANFLIAVLFQLPVVFLWVAACAISGAVAWRIVRWTWRKLFVMAPAN